MMFSVRVLFAVSVALPMTASGQCVSHDLLVCINDASSFWPKCDPSQSKSVAFPTLHGRSPADYGHFCTEEWVNALNAMLSDSSVDKCADRDAVMELLAQVAWETGYFSTLFQPADGGAGLIHMIPNNWVINAGDMEQLFPEGNFVQEVQQAGAAFFQSPQNGWRSAAAWYKLTNRVIPGCGLNLFEETFDTQTRCILGRPNDRSEAFGIVSRCFDAFGSTAGPQSTIVPTISTSTLWPQTSATATSTSGLASTTSVAIPTSATTSAFDLTSTLESRSALITSTRTGTSNGITPCSDAPLPIAWSGGGVHTCATYEQLDLAYCRHVQLQVSCCFCGGGQPEPTPMSTSEAMPMPTSTSEATFTSTPAMPITGTIPSLCVDGPLPIAWSGGGVHTCATYEQHGGSAYCAHQELASACCFCSDSGETRRLRRDFLIL